MSIHLSPVLTQLPVGGLEKWQGMAQDLRLLLPLGTLEGGSWLQATAQPSSGYCDHVGNVASERRSLSLSETLTFK